MQKPGPEGVSPRFHRTDEGPPQARKGPDPLRVSGPIAMTVVAYGAGGAGM